MMNAPFMSVVVCVNENLKTYIKPWESSNPTIWFFVCAGIAGGIAGIITNPMDVVKTRLQTQMIQPSCQRLRELDKSCLGSNCSNFETKRVHYRNVFQTAMQVYQQDGVSAFRRGIAPRMMINMPSTALSWGTYELMKGLLCVNKKE